MNRNKQVSDEISSLMPVLAETMKFAMQAFAQSTAVYEVMISKGLATKSELDAATMPFHDLKQMLTKILDEQLGEPQS